MDEHGSEEPARRALLRVGALAALAAGSAFVALKLASAPESPSTDRPTFVYGPSASAEAVTVTPETLGVPGAPFHVMVFGLDVGVSRFGVVDMAMSTDVESVLADSGASLVVNGGFFDSEHRAEGLVFVDGVTLSEFSPMLGGGVLVVSGEHAGLLDAVGFSLPDGVRFAIQARPRLIVDGGNNLKGDRGQQAERTVICLRDRGREVRVVIARGEVAGQGPTLMSMATILEAQGCEQALNLDGGPSTGVAWRDQDGVHAIPPRAPIRHAIIVHVLR